MKVTTKLNILFVIGLLILAFGFIKGFAHAAGDPTPALSSNLQTTETDMAQDDVVRQVNQVRTGKGLKPLKTNSKLEQAAAARVNNLCDNNYFAHTDKLGHRFFYYIQQADYSYDTAGENLAKGYATVDHAVTAWVASPSHYENIINPNYTETGVAVLSCPQFLDETNVSIIVQLFGKPYTQVHSTAIQESKNKDSTAAPHIIIGVIIVLATCLGFFLSLVVGPRKKL